jgi:hypothetical protein
MKVIRTNTGRLISFGMAVLLCAGFTQSVRAEVVAVEVHERRPFADGQSFGSTGPYETIRGRLRLQVDPDGPANERIADLKLAPRNADGRVEFWSDFFLLKPVDPLRGNRRILYDVNNRGNKLALWSFNGGERTNSPSTTAHAGDGFLMRQGYSVLWCGWNGDVVEDGNDRLLVGLPTAQKDGKPVRGKIHLEISVDEPRQSWTFGWSPWGVAAAYPTVDIDDPQAVLTMRPTRAEPARHVPRDQWAFGRWEGESAVSDPTSLFVGEGLRPGWLYDLVYTAEAPRVAGLGLAAIRDCVSFFRYAQADAAGTKNPLAESIEAAYVFGISQSGRLVNQFIYDGFNSDEKDRMVFDAAIAHVAGAGRGLFNHRFGLATLYGTQHRDNLVPSESFPMATVPTRDPATGRTGDLLARARAKSHVPKLFFIQTSTEYWSRGASLLHTDVEGERDVAIDPNVRIYLVAGAQHLGGGPPTRGICQNPRNILDDRPPILRALLVAMDRWVGENQEPPPSRYPRIEDGTLVPVETFRSAFPAIPGVNTPSQCYTPSRLDFGPQWEEHGVADIVPPRVGQPYRTLVPQVDADGNELAGIRLPDVAVPLGTFTGWNLRAAEYGAEGQLSGLDGSYLAFARTAEERRQMSDPRPAVHERYPTRAAYLTQYLKAVLQLQQEGFLIPEDALKLLRTAAERDL